MLSIVKKLVIAGAVVLSMASCATLGSGPLMGGIYTDTKYPVAVTGNSGSTKVGSAEAISILGIVATGDASVEAAAKSAGITKIHHVDAQTMSILGVYGKYTVYVYGE